MRQCPPDPGIFETFIRNLKPEDCSTEPCDFFPCLHVHPSQTRLNKHTSGQMPPDPRLHAAPEGRTLSGTSTWPGGGDWGCPAPCCRGLSKDADPGLCPPEAKSRRPTWKRRPCCLRPTHPEMGPTPMRFICKWGDEAIPEKLATC